MNFLTIQFCHSVSGRLDTTENKCEKSGLTVGHESAGGTSGN
jgi:hypothetical protein